LGKAHQVTWCLLAITGLDSPGLISLLEAKPAEGFDVVVVSIGVNDVTGLCPPSRWVHWQAQVAQVIAQRFSPRLLVHTALPPMHVFTALPQPLRWFFGRWAGSCNTQLAAALVGQSGRTLHTPFAAPDPQGLALDGFHPGPIAYAAWADSLSQLILAAGLSQAPAASSAPAALMPPSAANSPH
jgi:lysophospholipase L1-like esterase